MLLKIAKYFSVIFLLSSCGNHNKELKKYGWFKLNKNDSLNVLLQISDFDNYGKLLYRLKDITCHDSIPIIVLETKKKIRHIYPIEYCEVPMFDPKTRNTFYIDEDSIYKNERQVQSVNLTSLLKENYENMGTKADFADSPDKVLFIFEISKNKGMNGIQKHLELITKSYDSLETKNDLKILFWRKIDIVPEFENGELRFKNVE
ncbi:hypothetical protein [Flagellimonas aequoris]|uniref:Lipoprotein n=1 Tax=Flagellimonas aequoris TaxID=2306997 RepID=A0A418N3H9_9FLAO|nr:hypothetical protein [Allomuricauda aequoris]RIV68441.1 hypothetical protein D2U88_14580 [Allomuricauda aequoris]TXK00136.1 hypothetical protein FQ019_14425 [Allomuricauda aequoris]